MRGISLVDVPYFISNYKQIHITCFQYPFYNLLNENRIWSIFLNEWCTCIQKKYSFCKNYTQKIVQMHSSQKYITAINPFISINKQTILLLKRNVFEVPMMCIYLKVYARVLTKRCTTERFPHPVHSYLDIQNYDKPHPPCLTPPLPCALSSLEAVGLQMSL